MTTRHVEANYFCVHVPQHGRPFFRAWYDPSQTIETTLLHLSRGTATANSCRRAACDASLNSKGPRALALDGLLDSADRVCFYDCLGWLGLHHHLFAEHLPLASLGGRLYAGLQPGHTWDDELASLFHLSSGEGCQGVHDLGANCLLQPLLLGECRSNGTFSHALDRLLAALHDLHGRAGLWKSHLYRLSSGNYGRKMSALAH